MLNVLFNNFSMKAISINNLVKVYSGGTEALKGINLDIESGDFFGLLGPNGAGKTTIIGILTSLVNKSSGTVRVCNYDIDTELDKAKQMIGVVPQEFNFNIFEKLIDIIVQQAGYFGVPRKVALKEADRLFEILDLSPKRDVPAFALSGGMKRRLMIARALIHKPKLLILDEPTSGVDVELRYGMWKYLKELNKAGTTILLTTHYIEEAEQLCKNVAIINEGKIVKSGNVKSLLDDFDDKRYEVVLDTTRGAKSIKGYDLKIIDNKRIEVSLTAKQNLTDFISDLGKNKILVQDLSPKGNRLEQLFLNLVNK